MAQKAYQDGEMKSMIDLIEDLQVTLDINKNLVKNLA